MAITYPTTLDALSNPSTTDPLNAPSHAGQHSDANDILEALEAKVGVTTSAVTTSVDYKLANQGTPVASTHDGTATAGTAGAPVALHDHKHGLVSYATAAGAIGTAAAGTSAVAPSRGDHVHPTGAGTPTTSALGDAAATGAGPAAAMTNHVHGRESSGTTAAAVGTSAGGSATTPSKSDHVHATGAGTPSTQAFADAAATGTGPAAAMTDHKHAMPADPVTAHAAAADPHAGYVLESLYDLLGDIHYASANNTPAKLAGQITTTKKMLSQTGDGAVSAAPAWSALVVGDIPYDDATSNPLPVGTVADGTEASPARKDHVHAHETAHIAHDTIWAAANDYVRGSANDTAVVQTASAATPAAVGTASAGTAANPPSADDHVHGHEAAHIVHDTIWAAKGNILGGTANDAAAVLTVGADDTILMADAAAATGLKWAASASPSAVGAAAVTGTADTFTRGDHVHAGAPLGVDYLVGTATAGLDAEIAVGTAPGGELGGTWATPTVDTVHSGSSHAGANAHPHYPGFPFQEGSEFGMWVPPKASRIMVEAEDLSPTWTKRIDFNNGLAVSYAGGEASVNVDLGSITDWTDHIDGVGDPHSEYVLESLAAAKGDIYGASANDTPAITTVGADGLALVATSGASTGLAWAAPAPAAHGDTLHTDFTREVVFSPWALGLDSATRVEGGTTPNVATYVQLDDGVVEGVSLMFAVPRDYVAASTLTLVIYYSGNGGTGGQDFVYSGTYVAIIPGTTNPLATGAGVGPTAVDVAANNVMYRLERDLGTGVAGDMFRVQLERNGASGSDSYAGIIRLWALGIEYTAVQ